MGSSNLRSICPEILLVGQQPIEIESSVKGLPEGNLNSICLETLLVAQKPIEIEFRKKDHQRYSLSRRKESSKNELSAYLFVDPYFTDSSEKYTREKWRVKAQEKKGLLCYKMNSVTYPEIWRSP